jgi:hypothetical protein
MRERIYEQRGGLVDCMRVVGSQLVDNKSRLFPIRTRKETHVARISITANGLQLSPAR